jgi:DNA-binding NarL/FixJ family response regulator
VFRREVECLSYLSLGKSAKEIAKTLELSPRSVEFYLSNLKQKSGLKRGELPTYFVKNNPFDLCFLK